MKNKLTLAKYLIYGSAAIFLVLMMIEIVDVALEDARSWSDVWNAMGLWRVLSIYFVIPLLAYFSYQRFQKGKTQFNRGLYAIAIFAFLSYIAGWIAVFDAVGWDLFQVFWFFEQYWLKNWTTYADVLGLVALIWGVCLLVFVVDKKVKDRT